MEDSLIEINKDIIFRISLYQLLLNGSFKNGGKSEHQRFVDLYELKRATLNKLISIDFFQLEAEKGYSFAMSQKRRIDILNDEVNTLYSFYQTVTELLKLYDEEYEKMSKYYSDLPLKHYMQSVEIQNLKRVIKSILSRIK